MLNVAMLSNLLFLMALSAILSSSPVVAFSRSYYTRTWNLVRAPAFQITKERTSSLPSPQNSNAARTKRRRLTTTSMSSSSSVVHPRAAVSVIVRWSDSSSSSSSSTPRYVLVQRGKEPSKGLWSLPGGKIDVGEGTLDAAQRELFEETQLHSSQLLWHTDGPFRSTDSIHTKSSNGHVLFHYVISHIFCVTDTFVPPTLVPSDDADDAQWWNLERVQSEFDKGHVTPGVVQVLERSEVMYQKGVLAVEKLTSD